MGAFISLAFRVRGELSNLTQLNSVCAAVGLVLVDYGPVEEGQQVSTWHVSLVGESQPLTRRCYSEGGEIAATLDIEETLFDEIGRRLGRENLIRKFVALGCDLLRGLRLSYVFFEEEAEADIAVASFDGTRLFGITIIPADAPWVHTALIQTGIRRVDRFPGVVVVYRRLDPVPELG